MITKINETTPIFKEKNNNKKYNPNFTGPLDGVLTNTLRTLDTNPMLNAVGIDLFAMVAPRTYIDTKERSKYAGAETFFREFTGTLIVCLSASYIARAISKISNKLIKPEIKLNTGSWYSNDSLEFLQNTWKGSKNTKGYVSDILNSISGLDGKNTKHFKDIDVNSVEWVDEKQWSNFKWNDPKYQNIHNRIKDRKSIEKALGELIEDKSISKSDSKKLLNIIEMRITNILGADKVNAGKLSTSLHNLLRDSVDLGRDVFTNTKVNPAEALGKILKINRIKSLGALAIASGLGLTNQYINRKITEKRTGTQGFVGDSDYKNHVKDKKSSKDKSVKFFAEKLLASAGMALMAISVMKIKSPKDFIKKLELTGPVTSGNAIKTVYASTLIGRFLASDNKNELVETVTRDYLGFLNWLVFGGFAAKGVANLLDKNRENLFNISKEGKGIRHWLNNISLKSHNEIASKGVQFAKKNMWKLNLSHASGLAYSTIVLGVLLPKLNILINGARSKNAQNLIKLFLWKDL
jgi:hypothetical protein